MHWYGGSIAEAVSLSKQKNAIFVVFVEGGNEESVEMAATIDDSAIVSRLSDQTNFLAIKLKSGTENCEHFAMIYQFVPVPSLFFIGRNGTPLEVVCAGVQASNLATRIDRILAEHHGEKSLPQASTSSSSHNVQATVGLLQSEARASAPANLPKEANILTSKETPVAPSPPKIPKPSEPSQNQTSSAEFDIVCDGDVCIRTPKDRPPTSNEAPATSVAPAASVAPATNIAPPTTIAPVKTTELPKSTEAQKTSEAPKPTEASKHMEAQKTTETGKAAEGHKTQDAPITPDTPKARELPKANTAPKSTVATRASEAPRTAEASRAAETPRTAIAPTTTIVAPVTTPIAPVTTTVNKPPDATSSATSIDDKLERAKELIEAKRREKADKEKELEKQKELERRTTGQGVAELKKWQADQEMKHIQDERKREKLENELARQRILEQIAQDRAERKAKDTPTALPQPTPQPQTTSHATSGDAGTSARVQFKLPDGASHTAHFDGDGTLGHVHRYIADNLQLSASNFALWTAFPRRELTDTSATLRDLGLAPSAALLVLPRRDTTPSSGPTQYFSVFAFITQLLSTYIYQPSVLLFSWISGRLFPPPAVSRGPSSPPAASLPTGPIPRAAPFPRRRTNIHRLPGDAANDDDNNTWNGNSTQQM